jgi:uncharacterized protein (DUF983 family)
MSNLGNLTPQFGTAEYAGVAGTEHCQFCRQPISGRYYRVNSSMACAACGERAQHELPKDSHALFVRGLIFGVGAAILGLILYATVEIATGWIIGYVSLAVGYIIGKGIKMGSKGAGGRKYQIAAVILTYAAVSLAAVPVLISEQLKARQTQRSTEVQQPADSDANQQDQDQESAQPPSQPRKGLGAALLQLAMVGLASPFLGLQDPVHGLIGLVILFVGIRIAWRLAAGTDAQVFGPFESAPAAS